MAPLKIKPIELSALYAIAQFPPDDWHFDIVAFYKLHASETYFKAYIGYIDETPIVTGCIIFYQKSAWLGSIITDEKYRSRGFGRELTKYLIEVCQENHCESISLFGTRMGEELYRSMGFSISTYYHFVHFSNRKAPQFKPDESHIRAIKETDHTALTNMDYFITKNYRLPFLKHYLEGGLVYYADGKIHGYYLPRLHDGPIIALNEEAGINLLKYKIYNTEQEIMLPIENGAANQFLKESGAVFHTEVPRMHLFHDIMPDYNAIYSRGAGFCG